jgi:hypothetical protein
MEVQSGLTFCAPVQSIKQMNKKLSRVNKEEVNRKSKIGVE